MLTGRLFNIINLVTGITICLASLTLFFSQSNNNFVFLFVVGLLVLCVTFFSRQKNPFISQRLELMLLFISAIILNILPYLVKSNPIFLGVSVSGGVLLLLTILLTNFESTKN